MVLSPAFFDLEERPCRSDARESLSSKSKKPCRANMHSSRQGNCCFAARSRAENVPWHILFSVLGGFHPLTGHDNLTGGSLFLIFMNVILIAEIK